MLTRVTDDDWALVLDIFRSVCPRRGEKGRNDRRFLEALHYFTVHSITWRALPGEFGKWNSVWKRFWRLGRSGVFEAFFPLLAECSQTAHLANSSSTLAMMRPLAKLTSSRICRSASQPAAVTAEVINLEHISRSLSFCLSISNPSRLRKSEGLVVKSIMIAYNQIRTIKVGTNHRGCENYLMLRWKRFTNLQDLLLEILTASLCHTLILDVIHQ